MHIKDDSLFHSKTTVVCCLFVVVWMLYDDFNYSKQSLDYESR